MAAGDIPVVERKFEDLSDAVQACVASYPGPSLDVVEPQPIFQKMLEEHPRLRWEDGIGFFRMEDIIAAGRNQNIVTSDAAYGGMGAREPLIPLHVDGPTHRQYRRLLDPLLSMRAIGPLEPKIRVRANELIDTFIDDGQVELHDTFAVPFPCLTFLELFGLPTSDLEFLDGIKDRIIKNEGATFEERSAIAQGEGDKLRDYLNEKIDEREAEDEPRDDFLGQMLTFEIDGRRLTRSEILSISHLFVIAGLDTVTASISVIVGWLARNPEVRHRVLADESLIPSTIEELMRFENPVLSGGGRMAIADTEVNGVPIRAGESVALCWSTADLDPGAFENPGTVDIDRPGNRHIAFAAGRHRCLGSHLARLELRVALETLHRRFADYEITPGETPRYNHMGVRCAEYLPLSFTAS